MRRRATLAQVASAAGVSVSTASDALRGKGRVSPETRSRVRSAAKRLGYRAQGAARALRSGVRPLIVLHLDEESTLDPDGTPHLFWTRVITGFIRTVAEYDFGVIVDIGGDSHHLSHLPGQALVYGSTDPSRLNLPEDLGFGSLLTFSVDPDVQLDPEVGSTLRVHHDYREMGSATARFLRERGAGPVLVIRRAGLHRYVTELMAGLTSNLDSVVVVEAELAEAAAQQAVADALVTHPDLGAIVDLALCLQQVNGALDAIPAPDRPLVVTQAEVPPAHLRDPAVAYITFCGLECGAELAEHVVATLAGRPASDVLLPFAVVPPLTDGD